MQEKIIFDLIDRFNISGITSLEFEDGNTKLVLKREAQRAGKIVPPDLTDVTSDDLNDIRAAKPRANISALAMPVDSGQLATDGSVTIKSPIVAAFYASGEPDAPPFVKVGDKVKSGDTLCILEAMKMMNRLLAEFDCEILEVKASSGDLVEYGQPLFEVSKL